jgi:hypothetical protein
MLDDGCNNGECGGSAVGTANMFVKIAKNKPQYRTQALKIIARTYNISLAPGDRWDYAESIVSGGGTTFGWTPSQANDPYKDAKGTQHLANDSSVYLTGDLFAACETASCLGGIMAHEATHSWVESSIEAQGMERSPTDITASSAEEALADSIGMQLGDPEGLLMAHWNRSLQNYKDPRIPFAYLQDFYEIDLSNLLSQVFGR